MANPNMPHGEDRLDGKGYVVYTRQSLVNGKPTRWEYARLRQEEKINNWYSTINLKPTTDQYIAAGQYLLDLGEKEEKKERKLIQAVLGLESVDIEDEVELIKQFNEVLVGKAQYEDALHRIDVALNNKDNKGKNGAGLAPSISSFFTDKLKDAFEKNLNMLLTEEAENINGDGRKARKARNQIERQIVDVFYKSLDEAFENLLTYKTDVDDRWGTLQGYEKMLEVYQKYPYYKKVFQESLRKRFDPEKIKNIIRGENQKKYIKTKGKLTAADLGKDILKIKTRTGSLGGDVNEIINALRDMMANSDTTIDTNGTRISTSFKSNKMLTDNMTIFDIEGTIDTNKMLKKIEEKLDDKMEGRQGEDLVEAHKIMKEFWNRHLSKLDNSFIVFKNTKSYGLKNIENEFFGGGFKGGKSVSLDRFAAMPQPAGFNNIDINKFVAVIANTIPGAILEDQYTNISKWLYIYVTESIANLLFDDWERIGSEEASGANAIHALLLEDINIPLSVFLKGAGQALIDAANDFYESDYVRMNIYRSNALYNENEEGAPKGYPKSSKGHPRVGYAWNLQREDAMANYHISFRFYKNFNDEILRKIIAYKN